MSKKLSYDNLLNTLHTYFSKVSDPRQKGKIKIPIVDYLMSALAIFTLKYPSLLAFDTQMREELSENEVKNFKNLFGVCNIPGDTSVRQTLDQVAPEELYPAFKKIIHVVQRSKGLERFVFHNGHYLLSIDGTGFFSSHSVHCENCCQKNHKDGSVTYYHQALVATIVHPDSAQVIPIAVEPIQKQDGDTKNDCERNAAKRLLKRIREDFPKMKFIVVEDALAANEPHIRELKNNKMSFILGVKKGNNKRFFERVEKQKSVDYRIVETKAEKENRKHGYIKDIELKENNIDSKINFFDCQTIKNKKKEDKNSYFSWITDLDIDEKNIDKLSIGGRARWKIENETFNTLKNQGYQFEHNFGHGKKNLSNIFCILMLLAFMIDQISEKYDQSYSKARNRFSRRSMLWESMRHLFIFTICPNWETLFKIINKDIKLTFVFDTG